MSPFSGLPEHCDCLLNCLFFQCDSQEIEKLKSQTDHLEAPHNEYWILTVIAKQKIERRHPHSTMATNHTISANQSNIHVSCRCVTTALHVTFQEILLITFQYWNYILGNIKETIKNHVFIFPQPPLKKLHFAIFWFLKFEVRGTKIHRHHLGLIGRAGKVG